MDKLFQNKWAIRVMSLIFAVSLFFFVNIETDTAKTNNAVVPNSSDETQVLDDVPLDVKIDSDEYVVSGVPDEVTVSLKGKKSKLTPTVRQRSFDVYVDLRDLEEGEHTVEVQQDNIPKELESSIEPQTIDVEIEKRATQEFTLHADIANEDQLPDGYELGDVEEVTPETVQIVSAESVMDQIAMVRAYIDVKDVTESIEDKEVPINVYDSQGNDLNVNVEPETAKVSLDVTHPSKTVPLHVETTGDLPDGYEVKELKADDEIEIFGKTDALTDVEDISTEDIDLSEIEESTKTDAKIDFPDDVTAEEETVPVEIELEKTEKFDDMDVDIKGEGDKKAEFVDSADEKVTVEATGSDDVMKDLKESDITASIDVTDKDKGEHEMDVDVEGPEGVTFEPKPRKVKVEMEE
ncbi:MAG TPA: CdaR family protein [Pseudogracilibacillus sp.]|nr:CdaR family protein [Pseudogracilibacillus sp.]